MTTKKPECVVYWLYDEKCICPWRHGYIGISINFKNRLKQHRNSHRKPFEHEILFQGSTEDCLSIEAQMRPDPFIGWNRAPGGIDGPGREPKSADTKQKMREAALLRFSDPNERKKMSKIQTGREITWGEKIAAGKRGIKASAAARAKMSATRKGRPAPPRTAAHCAAISAANKGIPKPAIAESNRRRKGQKLPPRTPEHCAKISLAKKGKPNLKNRGIKKPWLAERNKLLAGKNAAALRGRVFSTESRAKMSAAASRRRLSPETRAKIGAASRLRRSSAETRAKISAARIAYWAQQQTAAQSPAP